VAQVHCDAATKAVVDASAIPADIAERDLVLVLEPVMASADRCRNLIATLEQRGVRLEAILVLAITMSPTVAAELASLRGGTFQVVSATIEAGVDSRGFLQPGFGEFHKRYIERV
jgi:uracil phosphoribosyltransferase